METRRDRAEWERVRWQSTLILGMFAKKGTRLKLQDVAVFPWEENGRPLPPPARVMTAEEQAEKFAKYDQKMREKWGGVN